jgi:small-conductance mechanosensitive channel
MIPNWIHELVDPAHLPGALLLGAVLLVCAIVAERLVSRWGRRLMMREQNLIDPTVVSFLMQLMKLACFLAALIIYSHLIPGLEHLGSALLASAGLVSLVIGLAAQSTLGNLIAGISLILYRPFGIGDVLTLNAPTGKETATVREFTLGYTKLLTEDGRWIIVPNSVIASNIIVRIPPK